MSTWASSKQCSIGIGIKSITIKLAAHPFSFWGFMHVRLFPLKSHEINTSNASLFSLFILHWNHVSCNHMYVFFSMLFPIVLLFVRTRASTSTMFLWMLTDYGHANIYQYLPNPTQPTNTKLSRYFSRKIYVTCLFRMMMM